MGRVVSIQQRRWRLTTDAEKPQQEFKRRLQKKLNNMKYNQDLESYEYIQAYTNNLKITYELLEIANKSWPSLKRKVEYLQNINLVDGHDLLAISNNS